MTEIEPWERLSELERQIVEAAPPIKPPACHWLNRDSLESYCHADAWEARWKELPTVGPCPPVPDWFNRTDLEHLMADGIDGCAGMGSLSDHPEACTTCGCTLEYLLTETGLDGELEYFRENPVVPGDSIDGEVTYLLTTVFMSLCQPSADPDKVDAVLKIASDVITAIEYRSEPVPNSDFF